MSTESLPVRKGERTPQSVLGQFLGEFDKLYGLEGGARLTEANIKPIIARDAANRVVAKAYHIRIRPRSDTMPKDGIVNFKDVDDSIVETSTTKTQLVDALTEYLPDKHKHAFREAAQYINKAARVLPLGDDQTEGIGQVRHAPLLEMIALDEAYRNIQSPHPDPLPTDESSARQYITHIVERDVKLGAIAKGVAFRQDNFQELDESALLIDKDGCPPGVSAFLWDMYKDIMTQPMIPVAERKHSDLPDSDLFIPATFGPLDHQARKLIALIEQWKESGARIPDEILIITAGSKMDIFNVVMNDPYFSNDTFAVFTDDRHGDDSLSNLKRVRPGQVKRSGMTNATSRAPKDIPAFDSRRATFREERDMIIFSYPNIENQQ